jgi:hypothetical protein
MHWMLIFLSENARENALLQSSSRFTICSGGVCVEGNKGIIVIRAVISLFSSCSPRCIRVRRKGRRRLRFVIVVDTWKKRSARQLVSVFSSFFFVFVLVVLRVLPSTRFAAAGV